MMSQQKSKSRCVYKIENPARLYRLGVCVWGGGGWGTQRAHKHSTGTSAGKTTEGEKPGILAKPTGPGPEREGSCFNVHSFV